MKLTLHDLEKTFNHLCDMIGAGTEYKEWFKTSPAGDGSPHVEIRGAEYHYVVTERGMECQRRSTRDAHRILYWLMSDVTSDLALKFELRNRKMGEDFRRQYFAEQERLLRKLHGDWAESHKKEVINILNEFPFDDSKNRSDKTHS